MTDAIFHFLKNLIHAVRIADILDIALISGIFYVFISWLRRSASRRAILAVSILGGVYILARILEMYMTQTLLQALFVLLLVAAIVVFQADIRRLVEWLGTWNWSRRNRSPMDLPDALRLLPEVAEKLAANHIGALIAIKGHDAWDLQIEGGIDLNGQVSKPLLFSIFDNHTPGHDGAVLIEGDRITKFAAHLPLSTQQEAIGERGTRHAAAVGLSEQCDAIVIVVSEERGVISVAEEGKLVAIPSASRLLDRLEWFWKRHRLRSFDKKIGWRSRNLQTPVLSIVLSVLLWLIFVYHTEIVFRTYIVPIEFRNLQATVGLEDPLPVEARVTLIGSEQAFRLLDTRGLAISFDIATLKEGTNRLSIAPDHLKLPSRIALHHVDPPAVQIKAYKMRSLQVPVAIKTTGALPNALELVSITSSPKTLSLLVPEKDAARYKEAPTPPVNLRQITQSAQIKSQVILSSGIRLQSGQSPEVTIDIQVRPKQKK